MSVLIDDEAVREIYLVFQNDGNYFTKFLVRRGFRHVFAIERQALGWVCIDPNRNNFYCCILPATFGDDVMGAFIAQNPNCTVMQLFVESEPTNRLYYPKFGFISCVGIIQYTLAVYWPFIITPYQLYCRLASRMDSHIKVGKIWAAKAQSVKHEQQQKPHERKQQT